VALGPRKTSYTDLNPPVVPEPLHELADFVGQLALARLTGELEEQASVFESEKEDANDFDMFRKLFLRGF
jgi:hypothetical protein